MPVFFVLFALAVLIVLGFSLKLLRIERLQDRPEHPPAGELAPPETPAEEPKEQKLINLIDYFADPQPEKTADDSQVARAAQEEQEERRYDKLCELPVGHGFLTDCQTALCAAREDGRAMGVAVFDFARFRFINLLKGYSTGDYILTRIAGQAREIFPENAMISRISADHFAALFSYVGDEQLQDLSDRLQLAAEQIRGEIGSKSGLRINLGIALAGGGESCDIRLLMHKADIARHCLKITKSSDFLVYDDTMSGTFLYGQSALEDYNEYRYSDDFEIYFQPLFDFSLDRITCCEALARWNCEETSAERPPGADDSRLPGENIKVVYQVCKALRHWRKAGQDIVPVFAGLSALDFLKEDVDAFFIRCLNEFQLEPAWVVAVLDAHTLRLSRQIAEGQLGKLRDIGVKIAVGGIGRTFGDLGFLDGLPLTYLKLHRGFAQAADKDAGGQNPVRAVIDAAARLGLTTVFEGVDSMKTARLLQEAGAGLAEGHYAGRPSSGHDFARDLQEHLRRRIRQSDSTVLLDDEAFASGDFTAFS